MRYILLQLVAAFRDDTKAKTFFVGKKMGDALYGAQWKHNLLKKQIIRVG